jgi:hypothetical protein
MTAEEPVESAPVVDDAEAAPSPEAAPAADDAAGDA